MPNPSTIASDTEERLAFALRASCDTKRSRGSRQHHMCVAYDCAEQLGIKLPAYNTTEYAEFAKERGAKNVVEIFDVEQPRTADTQFGKLRPLVYQLTLGQRMVIVDALQFLNQQDSVSLDADLSADREKLIELFLQK